MSSKNHFKAAQKAVKRSAPVVTTSSLGFHGQANFLAVTTLANQVIKEVTRLQRHVEAAPFNLQSSKLKARGLT